MSGQYIYPTTDGRQKLAEALMNATNKLQGQLQNSSPVPQPKAARPKQIGGMSITNAVLKSPWLAPQKRINPKPKAPTRY